MPQFDTHWIPNFDISPPTPHLTPDKSAHSREDTTKCVYMLIAFGGRQLLIPFVRFAYHIPLLRTDFQRSCAPLAIRRKHKCELWCGFVKRVQRHTTTIYTEAKINHKMSPNWPWSRSPVEFGSALRSILKMLHNAVPNSAGDPF